MSSQTAAATATDTEAETEASPIRPEDLLALVRKSSERFQKRDLGTSSEFQPRPYLAPVETPEPGETSGAGTPDDTPDAPATATPSQGAAPDDTGFTPAPPPPTVDIEAERQAAWAEGHAAALQQIEAARTEARAAALEEARAQAAEEIAEARDAFAAALTRLAAAEHERAEALTEKLEAAMRQLAAQRAGQKIDETPRPFLRRIEKMMRDVAAGCDSTVVQMNPADLVAIKPHLRDTSPLAQARLAPDPKLGRGDLRLRMDDITFSDIIAERDGGGLS